MIDLFISSAIAQEVSGAAAQEPSLISGILPLVLMIVVFYFLLIRPQQKKAADHRKLIEGLSRGDKVVTSGGIYGKIDKVDEEFVYVEIAEATRIKLDRNSVSLVLNRPETANDAGKKSKKAA